LPGDEALGRDGSSARLAAIAGLDLFFVGFIDSHQQNVVRRHHARAAIVQTAGPLGLLAWILLKTKPHALSSSFSPTDFALWSMSANAC
jgi:hypothetical protein